MDVDDIQRDSWTFSSYHKRVRLFQRLSRCAVCVLLCSSETCRLRSAPSVSMLLITQYSGVGGVLLFIHFWAALYGFLFSTSMLSCWLGTVLRVGFQSASLLYFILSMLCEFRMKLYFYSYTSILHFHSCT